MIRAIAAAAALLVAAGAFGARARNAAVGAPTAPDAGGGYRDSLGKETYRHYCETCHGADGKGDGFNAFNLDPKPPDFTAAGFQRARSDQDLAAAIAGGGPAVGRSAAMPPWGKTLSRAQRGAVLRHIRRFPR